MSKSYEEGMTSGAEGLNVRSKFALENESPADALSGKAPTGVFPEVSLSETNPENLEMSESGSVEGYLEQK